MLRLWVAATDYSAEMSVSDEILKRMSDSYRRLRNTVRFLLGNLAGFDPVQDALPPARTGCARSLGAGARRLQNSRRSSRPTALRFSTGSYQKVPALRRGPRRLLARCPQGPPVYAAGGGVQRGARPDRDLPSPRRWCAGWRRSILHRRGDLGAPARPA